MNDTLWEPPTDATSAPGLRVLVVDDDPDMQRYLRLCLERGWGRRCTVEGCGDGDEAVLLAERERFDLVVTDVRLPRMDGYALSAALDRMPTGAGVPVLFVTGEPDCAARASAFVDARADRALLTKPFNSTRLAAALAKLMETR